jgi:Bacterial Ig domain
VRDHSSGTVLGICLAGAALLVLASIGNARAACTVRGQFLLSSEGPWPMSLDTDAGKACGSLFGSSGAISYKRLYQVTPPQHGSVSLRHGGYFTYTPKAGYRGDDNFTLRICGNANGKDACANLKFNTTVH